MLTYITDRNKSSCEDLTDAKSIMETVNDEVDDMFYEREIKLHFGEKPNNKPPPKVELIMQENSEDCFWNYIANDQFSSKISFESLKADRESARKAAMNLI